MPAARLLIPLMAAVAFVCVAVGPAEALTLRTKALVPETDGYLLCTVEAHSPRRISIAASIVTASGTNVSEFEQSFRSSSADGFYAEERAGSFHSAARRCKVVVRGARNVNIRAVLTSFDVNGVAMSTVQAR